MTNGEHHSGGSQPAAKAAKASEERKAPQGSERQESSEGKAERK